VGSSIKEFWSFVRQELGKLMYLLKESSDFSFEYRDSHDFSRAIRICGSFFCARGSVLSQYEEASFMGQSSIYKKYKS
jgi:hypothetical protein